MKTLAFTVLTLFLFTGCASSDKKSTADKKTASQNQTSTVAKDTLSTELYSLGADTSGLQKIVGQLNYTGNEPFTRPAIFVSGTEMYVLTADEVFLSETFHKLNGKRVTIYGKIKETGNAAELEVHYYQLED